MDSTRTNLERAIADTGNSLRDISLKVGRNAAYLQQFLTRESPQVLPVDVAVAVAQHLDIDPRLLLTTEQQRVIARSTALMPVGEDPIRTSPTRHLQIPRDAPALPPAPHGDAVREIDAWSIDGDLARVPTAAEWHLPEGFVRYELRTSPDRLRVLVVEDASPETALRAGDRVIVDISRTAAPGTLALWEDGAVRFRALDSIPEGTTILGRVVWMSRTF